MSVDPDAASIPPARWAAAALATIVATSLAGAPLVRLAWWLAEVAVHAPPLSWWGAWGISVGLHIVALVAVQIGALLAPLLATLRARATHHRPHPRP